MLNTWLWVIELWCEIKLYYTRSVESVIYKLLLLLLSLIT